MRGRRGNWLPRCLYAFHRRIPTTGGSFYRAVLAPPSWRTTNKEPVTYIQFPLLLAPTALFVQGNRFPSLLEKHHYHWSSFLLHICAVDKVGVCNDSCIDSTFGGVWSYDVYSNRLNLVTLYINAIVVCPGERENCLNALKSIGI